MSKQAALFHKPKPARIGRKIAVAAIVLLVTLVVVFDLNWLRPQLNQNISEASGIQVKLGNIEFSFSSPSTLSLQDIRLQQPGLDGKIDRLTVRINLWSLLQRNLIIEQILLEAPKLAIDIEKLTNQPKTAADKTQQNAALPLDTVTIDQILVNDLNITDASSAQNFAVVKGNIQLLNLQLVKNATINPSSHLPGAKLQLYLTELMLQQSKLGSLKAIVQSNEQDIFIEQLTLDNTPSLIDLSATLHLPFDSPKIELAAKDNALQFEQWSHFFADASIKPQGLMTFSTSVSAQLTNDEEIDPISIITGSFNAELQPGKIIGLDINSALTALKDSQETNLLDIGGYLLTGPLGLIAGQLFDLSSGVSALGGETQVNHLSIVTEFSGGVIDMTNTALATEEYRLALKGKADIIKQEFHQFEFAILEQNGCADLSQTLNGPMSEPTSAVANSLLASIASPVTDIVSGVTNSISDCDVFYSGPVQHP